MVHYDFGTHTCNPPTPTRLQSAYSRNLDDCIPELKVKAIEHLRLCKESGLDIMITCTARTFQSQVALYAQGRLPLDEVNQLRVFVNLPLITDIENKKQDYEEVANIGRKLGLVCGADFKNVKGQPIPDYPHFQID